MWRKSERRNSLHSSRIPKQSRHPIRENKGSNQLRRVGIRPAPCPSPMHMRSLSPPEPGGSRSRDVKPYGSAWWRKGVLGGSPGKMAAAPLEERDWEGRREEAHRRDIPGREDEHFTRHLVGSLLSARGWVRWPPGTASLQQVTALSAIFKLGRCVLRGPGGAPGNRMKKLGWATSDRCFEAGWSRRRRGWRLEADRERRVW